LSKANSKNHDMHGLRPLLEIQKRIEDPKEV